MTGRPKKTYKFINPQGDDIEVVGLSEFCVANDLSISQMSAVANGKRKSHKGWVASEILPSQRLTRDGEQCSFVLIPDDALEIAKAEARRKNKSVSAYIGDIIELVAGGYID